MRFLGAFAERRISYRYSMKHIWLSLLVCTPLLGGCAASIAASAVGAAVSAANPRQTITEDLRQPAVTACTARASEQGEPTIIDAELRDSGRVIVWGTVESAGVRRSFECRYDGEVKRFTVRDIRSS
jgi:hypothetical protein